MNKFSFITALPVFNEVDHVDSVLDQVRRYSPHVLVVDDGSTDGTSELLRKRLDVEIVSHRKNLGYGAALITAFEFAIRRGVEFLVTIDCDGQHEPQRIPKFIELCRDVDILSGSRYLQNFAGDDLAPEQRRRVNQIVTAELKERLGLALTDAFCGFKAYRVSALRKLKLTETGYAMPLELWVQAAHHRLSIIEQPVPRIYLDFSRSFGGQLDDMSTRLEYYHLVIDRSLAAVAGPARTCGAGRAKKDRG